MKIDAGGLLFALVDPPDAGCRVAVRQQTHVCPAAHRRDCFLAQRNCGDRDLVNGPCGGRADMRLARESWNSVAIVLDRIDTRIVSEAELGEDLECPER